MIYDCKNNHTNNILINDFEKTQKIIETKIICDNCKINNKEKSFNKEFYICCQCKMNLCSLCKETHNKNHNIIKYELRNYIRYKHDDNYTSYFDTCKMNICIVCENEHSGHEIISFEKILPKKEELNIQMKKYKENIYKFKDEIKKMKKILEEIMENMDKYYKIIIDILNSINIKKRNYEILNNINEINNCDIFEDIQ